MASKIVELAEEQKFFDRALEQRESHRHEVKDWYKSQANIVNGSTIGAQMAARTQDIGGPDEAVAIGRMDLIEDDETFYVGRFPVWEDGDAIVVSWKSDFSRPFYEASRDDPHGLSRKRTFVLDGNSVLDFDELLFGPLASALVDEEPTIADALLADLQRHRTGEMQDIVRTIQGEQSKVMRLDPEQLLIVQGGPGTGKTIVGLHRASWLLYNQADKLGAGDLLVVGPSRTFIRYIHQVLPGLGDRDVRHATPSALAPEVRSGGEDPPDVARLKGERRMEALLDRGLQDRIVQPKEDLTVRASGREIKVRRDELATLIRGLRDVPYSVGRSRLRDAIRRQSRIGPTEGGDALENAIDQVWPQLTAPGFLRDLLGSEGRLLSAAGDDFSAADVRRLYRRRADRIADEVWSPHDLPLLDYAESRIAGEPGRRYAHIVVDEAQDLSPMQLASIRRRSSTGAYTVLGDIAQSTGLWARDSWEDVIAILRRDAPVATADLPHGYRVPRQVYELAASLLAEAAPGIRVPDVVRDGPAEPAFVPTDEDGRAAAVVTAVRDHASRGLSVGVVCPDPLREEVSEGLSTSSVSWTDARKEGGLGLITMVSPDEAKGLEFEAVVVVEPELVAAPGDRSGLRMLYVALTRTTKYLSIVHAGRPMPQLQGRPPVDTSNQPPDPDRDDRAERKLPSPEHHPAPGPAETPRVPQTTPVSVVDLIASGLAREVRTTVQPEQWEAVIEALMRELLDDQNP